MVSYDSIYIICLDVIYKQRFHRSPDVNNIIILPDLSRPTFADYQRLSEGQL